MYIYEQSKQAQNILRCCEQNTHLELRPAGLAGGAAGSTAGLVVSRLFVFTG